MDNNQKLLDALKTFKIFHLINMICGLILIAYITIFSTLTSVNGLEWFDQYGWMILLIGFVYCIVFAIIAFIGTLKRKKFDGINPKLSEMWRQTKKKIIWDFISGITGSGSSSSNDVVRAVSDVASTASEIKSTYHEIKGHLLLLGGLSDEYDKLSPGNEGQEYKKLKRRYIIMNVVTGILFLVAVAIVATLIYNQPNNPEVLIRAALYGGLSIIIVMIVPYLYYCNLLCFINRLIKLVEGAE